VVTAFTITLHGIEQANRKSESYNVNVARAYTSVVVNQVKDRFPVMNKVLLEEQLEELNITALVMDLVGNELYNNTSFTTDEAMSELNQTSPYVYNDVNMIKASFHVVDDAGIRGFIVFGIPQEELIAPQDNTLLILIIIEVAITITLIIYLRMNYQKMIIKPIQKLDNALLDISNGIYNKLRPSKGVSVSRFTNYNIMLEQMERTLSIQADYEKSRKQLIANISHEVRTPLAYVKLSAELLAKNDCIDEKNKKYIDTILNKISSIDGIIEDLFRYSKQDLDRLLVVLKETYSKDMFDRIFSNIKLKDESKKIIIKTSNNIPNVLINVDENRLVQVISNLVDNSEKHIQKKGFITIKTEMEEDHLVLIVEDSGDGIAPKDLPYIFEPFYQGMQDEQTKKKGSGLGLAICEYIIKKHNGEIFVYSELGKGTKFVIKFQEIK
jgi:signal transduction histidine kinase